MSAQICLKVQSSGKPSNKNHKIKLHNDTNGVEKLCKESYITLLMQPHLCAVLVTLCYVWLLVMFLFKQMMDSKIPESQEQTNHILV